MFHKEFYPTPRAVIEQMGIDCYGKTCLEPQAGKGDIVDFLREFGAKEVLACELHTDLQRIVAHKARLIGSDFFKIRSEQISHVELIVMNPPFSNAHRHILHAWEIAPEGCEIISLCNWETCGNDHRKNTTLTRLIENYGEKMNLGDCFTQAERKTGVEVGLVRLFKPVVSSDFNFDGFFYTDDDNANAGNGIMPYNEIRAIVNSYVAAVKCWDTFREVASQMEQFTNVTGFGTGFTFHVSYNQEVTNKEDFARYLQMHCWMHVFKRMGADKYVTKGVKEDINKFINQRQNYPFTMRNVYRMIEILVGTRSQVMDRAIVEAIDKFTTYTHENRYLVEGWKTNAGHMLNKKFISGWISEPNWTKGLGIKEYNGNFEHLLDLTKACCYITGTNYDNIPSIKLACVPKDENGYYQAQDRDGNILERHPNGNFVKDDFHFHRFVNENQFEPNVWYDWGFFEFKVFKKGTGHFKFKDLTVWERLNRKYAEIKGQVLPEKI